VRRVALRPIMTRHVRSEATARIDYGTRGNTTSIGSPPASGRSTELSIGLPAAYHLLTVSIQRIIDDRLSGNHFVVVLEPEMAKPPGACIQSGWFQRELSVSAPFTILANRTRAGSRVSPCFLTNASNEHSFPWCPNSTPLTSSIPPEEG
jgi:hypothetical protein